MRTFGQDTHLKDERRLDRLLVGCQIVYGILSLIGLRVNKRWHSHFSSRPSVSIMWLALQTLDPSLKPKHRKVWRRHI
jgi:hypothetical protein